MKIWSEHTAERATVQFSLMASYNYLQEYFHLAKVINLILRYICKALCNQFKVSKSSVEKIPVCTFSFCLTMSVCFNEKPAIRSKKGEAT